MPGPDRWDVLVDYDRSTPGSPRTASTAGVSAMYQNAPVRAVSLSAAGSADGSETPEIPALSGIYLHQADPLP